jgi:hypothetical protein
MENKAYKNIEHFCIMKVKDSGILNHWREKKKEKKQSTSTKN